MLLFILIFLWILIVGGCVYLAYRRGVRKSRFTGIRTFFCVLLSALLTVWTRSAMARTVMMVIKDTESNDNAILRAILSENSMIEFAGALMTPVICTLYFLLFLFVSYILYLIAVLSFPDHYQKENCKAKKPIVRSVIWGALTGLTVISMLFLPLSSYSGYAEATMEALEEKENLSDRVRTLIDEKIEPIAKIPIVPVYRATGSDLFCDMISTFRVGEEKMIVRHEIPHVISFAVDISEAVSFSEDYDGANDSEALLKVADSMGESDFFASVTGCVVGAYTENYFSEQPAESGDSFEWEAMRILNRDAENVRVLRDDLYTLAEVLDTNRNFDFNGLRSMDSVLEVLEKNTNMESLSEKIIRKRFAFERDENGDYSYQIKQAARNFDQYATSIQQAQIYNSTHAILSAMNISPNTDRINFFSTVILNEFLPYVTESVTPKLIEDFLIGYIVTHHSRLIADGLLLY